MYIKFYHKPEAVLRCGRILEHWEVIIKNHKDVVFREAFDDHPAAEAGAIKYLQLNAIPFTMENGQIQCK